MPTLKVLQGSMAGMGWETLHTAIVEKPTTNKSTTVENKMYNTRFSGLRPKD